MRNFSPLPSLLFCQQHSSGEAFNSEEGLESSEAQLNHAGSVFSSGFSYLTPPVTETSLSMNSLAPPIFNQCSSSNAERESHFGQQFQSDILMDTRKRLFEELVPREGIYSMISNTAFPDESHLSKRKAFEQPAHNQVLIKAPVRRSQKLSDKITSLQKVVSPYGKTDTASVLQEACMYIKIAHQDIRRLTVSYFGNGPFPVQLMHNNLERWYPNLHSKGLCLVPLSMTAQLSAEDPDDGSSSSQGATSSWGL